MLFQHDAQMDYYGCRLATCSSDRSVRIYDVKNGTQTLTADLRGHEGPVSYLDTFSKTNSLVELKFSLLQL